MIPKNLSICVSALSFPRTRGDDPLKTWTDVIDYLFSPHPRG